MAGPPAEVTATGWLVAVGPGPGGPGDRPVVHRRELQVTAPEAGLAAEVVALLALDDAQASDLVDRAVGAGSGGGGGADLAAGAPVVDDPPVVVALATTEHPGEVAVTGPSGGAEQRRPRAMVADGLLSSLTRARLDEDGGAPRLHGAALTDGDGRTVVLLGTSGAGKSTLAAGLAAAGLDLLNDEQITVLTSAGRVAGFPRPLSIKPGSLPHLPARVLPAGAGEGSTRMLLTAAALGSRHRLAGRPALVVVPERSDDHGGPPTWEVVGPADAVRELCTHNLDLERDPEAALDAFAWLATVAPMVRLRYGEASEAVPVLARLLADPPPHRAPDWSVEVEPQREVGPAVPTVGRRPGVLTAWVGDGAVVFEPAGRGVAVLNREGVAVWRSLPWADASDAAGPGQGGDAPPLVVPGFVADLAARGFVALAGRAGSVYGRVPGLVARRVRGTVIVARPDHQVARLEDAAAAVWDALDRPGRADEVVTRIGGGGADAVGDRSLDDGDGGWEGRAVPVEAALALLVDGGLVRPDVDPAERPADGDEGTAGVPGPGGVADGTSADPAPGRSVGRASPVDGPDPGTVEGVLARVAGWLLPGAPPIEPLENRAEADLLVDRATTLRLLGPLLVAVDAGALELPPSLVERVVARHEDSMLWCLHLEVRLLLIRRELAAAGVPFVLTKGAAVAHLDDLDPSLRSFVDLDLLVPGAHLDEAVAVLDSAGARRSYVERRPGFDRRFVKSVTMRFADEVEVDVHRTLCDGTHGFRIPVDRLHADAVPLRLGGEEIRTLSRPHRALHAAYHGVLGSAAPPLRTVRDVAAYIASPDLPPEVLAAEAREWRGEAVLAEAVRTVFATFDLDAPLWREWLDRVVIDPREARIVDAQRVESGSFGGAKLTALRELGWSDRLAYATAVVLPTSAHLRSRGIRRTDVVRTAASRAGGAAREALGRARRHRR